MDRTNRRGWQVAFAAVGVFAMLAGACSTGSNHPTAAPSTKAKAGEHDGVERASEGGAGEQYALAPARPTVRTNGVMSAAVSRDVDLRTLDPGKPVVHLGKEHAIRDEVPVATRNAPDAVRQTAAPLGTAPVPKRNFAGLDFARFGDGHPPDTNGDVGPDVYIQTVNTSIGIFDKATSKAIVGITYNAFFGPKAPGPCGLYNYGDPTVVYDSISGRWIISDFAFKSFSGPFYQCIAVSKTADPVAGGWWQRALFISKKVINDYPKFSIWPDGIYMTANMFGPKTYNGDKVWAFNRDDLIAGKPLHFVAFQTDSSVFSFLAANARAQMPPAGTPEYLLSRGGPAGRLKFLRLHIDWGHPSRSSLTGPTSIQVATYERAKRVAQPAPGEDLDALSDRLMNQLQYTESKGVASLYATHTVASGGVNAIRWYQIGNLDGAPKVLQQSTYQPDGNNRWMPSLAVDRKGDLAVGYSVDSITVVPGIRYAARLAGDPPDQLARSEVTLVDGKGVQTHGFHRWGDYSAMVLDPDGCTFWYTTEYMLQTGPDWQTRIGSFKFPSCK